MVTSPQDLQGANRIGQNQGTKTFNKSNRAWTTKAIDVDTLLQQQVKHPKRTIKIIVGEKHSKILQGVIIDRDVHVANMMIVTRLLYTKKKKSSPSRMWLDVLLAT